MAMGSTSPASSGAEAANRRLAAAKEEDGHLPAQAVAMVEEEDRLLTVAWVLTEVEGCFPAWAGAGMEVGDCFLA